MNHGTIIIELEKFKKTLNLDGVNANIVNLNQKVVGIMSKVQKKGK